jgi:D-beta-D-heptose 7-phosphate kinase / D-beta-D-heptose 1-phosphate adenosyltransferase
MGAPGRLLLPTAVPSIVGVTTTRRPGGAGLAAVWAARMSGWRVCLITALGMDENGCEVRGHLDEADVELVDLGQGGMTMSKSRVIAHGQTVIRYDEAGTCRVPDLDDEAADTAAAALQAASAIIACDYGQGLLASPRLRAMLTAAAQKAPVVWDPHPRGTQPVVGVTVVVPNSADAAELCDRDPLPDAPERLADDVLHGARLLERWKAPAVAVTRGPFGAVLLMGPGSTPLVVPATDVADGDACGAGDVFAVRLVTGLAVGTLLPEAVELAVREASAYVRDGGPAILNQTTDSESGESLTRIARIKQRGGLVVATAGCFDVLHTGHISLLGQAKALGDHLVVCLNSDESVRELKGEGRPVVPANDRVAMLTALECVDEVLVFSETTPLRILEMIRPNIYVKGADYALNDIPEREIVEAYGGQVVLLPYLAGRSTTGLLRTAASSFKE